MMVGLAGSGKSTYARQIANANNAVIHASDTIRKELTTDENCQDVNNEVFQLLHKRIREDLLAGKNVVYDATNIDYKRRMEFLKSIITIACGKQCVLMATPYDVCIKQNLNRERRVPDEVITRMYKNFYIPQYYEGWDNIEIIWNFNKNDFNSDLLFERLNDINQDNPYHTLTVGKHCERTAFKTAKLAREKYGESYFSTELYIAALLHDIGKEFTKNFKNSKNEITDVAHYYQHHLVSAYDSLFYLKSEMDGEIDILKTVNYIQWHMQPYLWENDKQRNKYKELWGEEFYNNIILLHEADKTAK